MSDYYIVEGKPTEILDSYFEQEDIPFTLFNFKISKVYKGEKDIKSKYIKVTQDGNKEDSFRSHPLMNINEKYVLFLKEIEDGRLIMIGGPNGKFEYKNDIKAFQSNVGETVNDSKLKKIN
ncbi:hypothetical protein GLW08_21445 [Pontibacillus yanchengensis]|uniref:Uncharacterized protein n=2 Tax=Pontibacillus yanchengensis TaxID=462910 RepID=A0ACC7VMP5_9BACI|nr:hypothetical protein [Pontibacillus yanchengensis]MYL36143.1 hypothetical protein [Pontibacillus yanchengensis]MYL55869.1 hypothetical protein [Pontibacillus yanchengensis]